MELILLILVVGVAGCMLKLYLWQNRIAREVGKIAMLVDRVSSRIAETEGWVRDVIRETRKAAEQTVVNPVKERRKREKGS